MSLHKPAEVKKLRPQWLRLPAAIQYSGMSKAKLYELKDSGQIETLSVTKDGKVRGLRFFSASSIDQYLERFVS